MSAQNDTIYHAINCSICLEDLFDVNKRLSATRCGHTFHMECIEQHRKSSNQCPLCKQTISIRSSVHPLFLNGPRPAVPMVRRNAVDDRSNGLTNDCTDNGIDENTQNDDGSAVTESDGSQTKYSDKDGCTNYGNVTATKYSSQQKSEDEENASNIVNDVITSAVDDDAHLNIRLDTNHVVDNDSTQYIEIINEAHVAAEVTIGDEDGETVDHAGDDSETNVNDSVASLNCNDEDKENHSGIDNAASSLAAVASVDILVGQKCLVISSQINVPDHVPNDIETSQCQSNRTSRRRGKPIGLAYKYTHCVICGKKIYSADNQVICSSACYAFLNPK